MKVSLCKSVFCSILLLISIAVVKAQEKDSSYFKVSYEYSFKPDSTKPGKFNDLLILEIGKNTSYCYSYYSFLRDSVLKAQFEQQQSINSPKTVINSSSFRRGLGPKYFRDLTTQSIRFIDLIGLDWYLIEDNLEDLKWNILNDTAYILDFLCYKAKTNFRGRVWNAWFTDKIPLSAGPLKFGGLPGLILKIEDEKNNFTVTSMSIEKVTSKNLIEIPQRSYLKVDNRKYKKVKRSFLENPEAYMSSSTMEIKIVSSSLSPPIRSGRVIMNPLELD